MTDKMDIVFVVAENRAALVAKADYYRDAGYRIKYIDSYNKIDVDLQNVTGEIRNYTDAGSFVARKVVCARR